MYRWAHEAYHNDYFNESWESLDEWCLFAGFNPRDYGWFKRTVIYYDGHEIKAWSFLGLVLLGWSYTRMAVPTLQPQPVSDFDFEDTVWPFDEEPH